jgi:hypothetical protein
VLLSMGPTEKQIARLTNIKSVISTKIGAVLNMGGSRLLYLLYVPSKTGLVESTHILSWNPDRASDTIRE